MGEIRASVPSGQRQSAPRSAKPPSHAPSARGQWPQARHYAALDLGTNNCRLLVARPQGNGFAVVDAFSRIVRLGEGLAATGRLSDEAIDRTIAALRVCADKLKRRDVALSRAVATEACRRAANGAEFIERAYRETGIVLDIISAEEEARLAVLGCHALIEPGEGAALVFDIGGGSTELVLVDTRTAQPTILDWHSAPWGVVSLTESVGSAEPDTYATMRATVRASFADFAARIPRGEGRLRLLGTSGTVTTLASVHLGLDSYDRSAVDGLLMPAAAMRAVSQRIAGLNMAGRSKVPCIGEERADLVVAGCAILEEILDIWPAEQLGIADRGIREGILRRLMSARR